jgi:branched-chain amino acid aminotransferase
MSINITKVAQSRLKEVDFNNLPFGKVFSDHMLVADYIDGAWQTPEIIPFGDIPLSPSLSALHHAQAIF